MYVTCQKIRDDIEHCNRSQDLTKPTNCLVLVHMVLKGTVGRAY